MEINDNNQKQTISDQKQTISDQRQIISDHIKEAERQKQMVFDINEILERTANLLSNAIELRDPYTKGHSEHVAEITKNIACKMFSKEFINIKYIKIAALLHDVGKIGISETVLNKPTLLTDAEYIMIQSHTTLGEKLIKPMALNKLLTEAILFHHEDYDGGGYPKGLQGEDIPLIARIIRIADYFDALTTNRPYREPLNVTKALEIMTKNKKCFDPEIFNFFVNNITQLTRRCT
ncbi:HD-GYP domain-containing protein [Desulfobacula sp.]